jgi:putative methionine-R-sulfoxide reductase with GAF domain
MHPIDHYETLRRGREELLKRAEYERMVRKAKVDKIMNRNIHHAANWLGIYLVSLGEKLEQFGSFTKTRQSHSTYTPTRPLNL